MCSQACARLLVSLLQSRVDSMVQDTLITVGLVSRQLSGLFLGIRRQQLSQNTPPPSLPKSHSAASGRGQGGGRVCFSHFKASPCCVH